MDRIVDAKSIFPKVSLRIIASFLKCLRAILGEFQDWGDYMAQWGLSQKNSPHLEKKQISICGEMRI
jgi:hypothetical protein